MSSLARRIEKDLKDKYGNDRLCKRVEGLSHRQAQRGVKKPSNS